jgi:hypothetical protein
MAKATTLKKTVAKKAAAKPASIKTQVENYISAETTANKYVQVLIGAELRVQGQKNLKPNNQ